MFQYSNSYLLYHVGTRITAPSSDGDKLHASPAAFTLPFEQALARQAPSAFEFPASEFCTAADF